MRELADPVTHRPARGGAIPPRRLRARVGAPGAREFAVGGAQAASELARALSAGIAGASLGDFGSILDFGCGAGRVLPHVAALAPRAHCAGCDVDPGAITWAARHLKGQDWVLSGYRPPLPFADGRFELVYSISVFSHLDEPGQDAWLRELSRVLAGGGIALLSVHGAHAFERFRLGAVSSAWCEGAVFDRGPLGAGEFVFAPYRRSVWNAIELAGVGGGYGLAFHGEEYVRRRWGSVLGVAEVCERAVAGWQDVVVCRRR